MTNRLPVWVSAWLILLLSGCGHIITRQEPTATLIPSPTDIVIVRRTTATPKPATPMPTMTLAPSPTPITHVVKRGDTLLGIAIQYGVSVEAVQEANGIVDPRRLQLDQELIIPQDEGARNAAPPTATATPVAYAIENVGFYQTAVGSLWFMGEVHNTTTEPIEQVQIQVTLQGKDGAETGRSTAFAVTDIVEPGGRSPFAVLFTTPPDSFAGYQVVALAGVASTHPGKAYPDVSVTHYSGAPQGETLAVSGEVKNTGTSDAEAVTIIVTGYDSANRVVAIRAMDLAESKLLAGETAPFRVNLLSAGGPIVSYVVQVQARRV
jgi:murein DD-endopeptidase MepM/ murein hydrolase activator NlpD